MVFLIAPSVYCQSSNSFTVTTNSTNTVAFTNISVPRVSITAVVTVPSGTVVPANSSIVYYVTGNTTGVNLDSSTLPVPEAGTYSGFSIILPCKISTASGGSEAGITIEILFDAVLPAGISAAFTINVDSSDLFNGKFVNGTAVTSTGTTNDKDYFATLYIPPGSGSYAVNVTADNNASPGSALPFTSVCVRIGSCDSACSVSQDIAASSLTLQINGNPGVYYYLDFTVAGASQGSGSVKFTSLATLISANPVQTTTANPSSVSSAFSTITGDSSSSSTGGTGAASNSGTASAGPTITGGTSSASSVSSPLAIVFLVLTVYLYYL